MTEIVEASTFYPAEEYHQNYHHKNPLRYKFYKWNCGPRAAAGGAVGRFATALIPATCCSLAAAQVPTPAPPQDPPIALFAQAASADEREGSEALREIAVGWRNGFTPLLVDLARFLPSPRRVPSGSEDPIDLSGDVLDPTSGARGAFPSAARLSPGARARQRVTAFLERQTGQRFGDDLRAWRRWMWSQPDDPHEEYARFKGLLYARIDPAFGSFFSDGVRATIRLDEIDWGGVRVNGIPPLRQPRTIPAASAGWLKDSHVIFGVVVNGEARAYPKRILAWHEMAIDRLGGVELTIVYCTLCGTVIPYESVTGTRRFTFGTSGLLYRSNKLMFDEETRSLWSALDGQPVVGPLAGSGLQLSVRSVVTTTWGEWRKQHPQTTVLSLDTGYERDYSEGAAYRDYFSTDRVMFEVAARDTRLKNKAEVLVLRRELIGEGAVPVAISVEWLRREPVFAFEAGGRAFVVVTSKHGANRIYEREETIFVRREADGRVRDAEGRLWRAEADALVSERGERRPAVPSHRAFWFGWYAQHPDTVLYR